MQTKHSTENRRLPVVVHKCRSKCRLMKPACPVSAFPQRGLSSVALCATPARPPRPVSLSSVVLLASLHPAPVLLWIGNPYYTLPQRPMTFSYSHPVLCNLNEIAFSGISLYTLLSPSSLRTCPERCVDTCIECIRVQPVLPYSVH